MGRIPLYLVTGFLGSGKTTFIDRIIESFDQKFRIGIIQNEFAPANIDGEVLKKSGRTFEMLEINNGSVFCICLMGNFIQSMADFIREKKPGIIFIEASGLSDPASIIEIVQHPLLMDLVFLRETWCIVDARHFLNLESMANRVRHQILIADRLMINKKDLVTPDVISEIRKIIQNLNPYAGVFETSYCQVDFKPFPGQESVSDYIQSGNMPECIQGRPDINAGVFKTGRKISLQDLDDLIRHYAGSTARIKGNVLLANGHTARIQTVFREVNISISRQLQGSTCLVIMGKDFNLSAFSKHFRALTIKHEHQIL
jgi:G3E family GTPase